MTKQTLTGSIIAKMEAEKAKATKDADTRLTIAQAWDNSGFDAFAPWLVSGGHGLYGAQATLHFKAAQPDQLAALMRHFPAIPTIEYSHGGIRYHHPEGARVVPEGANVTHRDGFEIEVSGGKGFDSFKARWQAMVGDIQTSFIVDIARAPYLHPQTRREGVYAFGRELIRFKGNAELIWPDSIPQPLHTAQAQAVSYYNTDDSSGNFRIRGKNMLALAEAWEAEATRRGELTEAAFLEAWAPVEAIPMPDANDIAREAEKIADSYARESLRPGTLEQTAALETPRAKAELAVAEKHWKAFAEKHGIETTQSYFDRYSWACDFLKRCGLYEVNREGSEKPYKYGHAWL